MYKYLFFVVNPFQRLLKTIEVDGSVYKYYDLLGLNDSRYGKYIIMLILL